MKVVLGILVGILIVKAIRRARWRHGGHGLGFRFGGCGAHHGRGRLRRVMWAAHKLELDPRQMDELKEIWLQLRRTVGEVQFGRWRTMSDVVEVATGDPLDKTRLDELAAKHGEAHAKAARDVAGAIAKLHEILRPEQRAKLRELVERSGLWHFRGAAAGAAPSDGPYR